MANEDLRHQRHDVGQIELHVVESGPTATDEGHPLVVLLHGFPEFWGSWREQLLALGQAGFRTVAPDLRGYNLSDQPQSVADYHLPKLEADVAGLIRACGEERAVVVGHDWGAAIAWSFAAHHPEMVQALGILNGPHPQRFRQGLRRWRQRWKSAYMLFFQLPRLPEWILSRRDHHHLRRIFAREGWTAEEIAPYVEAARRSHRLRGGLNYYRAAGRKLLERGGDSAHLIEAPTLVIWGVRDRFLEPTLAHPDPNLVPHARVVLLPEASHWVQHDASPRVNELLLQLARGKAPTPA